MQRVALDKDTKEICDKQLQLEVEIAEIDLKLTRIRLNMESELYETDSDYKPSELEEFANWLDENIGTDYDVNADYLLIFDLDVDEVAKIAKFEHFLRKKYRKKDK
jgi:hypothetical protein